MTSNYIIKDKFKSKTSTNIDFEGIIEKHFCWFNKDGSGGRVYNITDRNAKFLLHNLEHYLPTTPSKISCLFKIRDVLSDTGIKGNWPNNPIIIDVKGRKIVKGTLRLFALSMSTCRGTYFEIKLINKVDKE